MKTNIERLQSEVKASATQSMASVRINTTRVALLKDLIADKTTLSSIVTCFTVGHDSIKGKDVKQVRAARQSFRRSWIKICSGAGLSLEWSGKGNDGRFTLAMASKANKAPASKTSKPSKTTGNKTEDNAYQQGIQKGEAQGAALVRSQEKKLKTASKLTSELTAKVNALVKERAQLKARVAELEKVNSQLRKELAATRAVSKAA